MRDRDYHRLRRFTGDTVVTDHGALTGLTDDDHSQYHTDSRGDARYYTQSQVDALLAALDAINQLADGGASDAVCETFIDGGSASSVCTDYPFAHKIDCGASA